MKEEIISIKLEQQILVKLKLNTHESSTLGMFPDFLEPGDCYLDLHSLHFDTLPLEKGSLICSGPSGN